MEPHRLFWICHPKRNNLRNCIPIETFPFYSGAVYFHKIHITHFYISKQKEKRMGLQDSRLAFFLSIAVTPVSLPGRVICSHTSYLSNHISFISPHNIYFPIYNLCLRIYKLFAPTSSILIPIHIKYYSGYILFSPICLIFIPIYTRLLSSNITRPRHSLQL